ncbi:MAG: CooT family nickel-binding protein [Chloroflexi bacterium]|jgi:predicted RNA-binding protein|nr:CooT family nickel-binding protein [Chloroflexota bacterium]
MCQVTVYLDDEKIMDNVMLVEPLPEGIRLVKMFEPPRVVPATIRQIDLMKNKLILETIKQDEENHEGDR